MKDFRKKPEIKLTTPPPPKVDIQFPGVTGGALTGRVSAATRFHAPKNLLGIETPEMAEGFLTLRMMANDPKVQNKLDEDEMQNYGEAYFPMWDDRLSQPDDVLNALIKKTPGDLHLRQSGDKGPGLYTYDPETKSDRPVLTVNEDGKIEISPEDLTVLQYFHDFGHNLMIRLHLTAQFLQYARATQNIGYRNIFCAMAEATVTRSVLSPDHIINAWPMFVAEGNREDRRKQGKN